VWWTEVRGLIVVALVAGGIAFAWTRIEARPIDEVSPSSTTTTSTTTTTVVPTTSLSRDEANQLICERARSFVDEAALVEALRAGTIAGAGLDVFDNEPLPADHPLRSIPSTVLTGHTGYVMQENYALGYAQAVEDIAAWLAGDPIRVLNEVGE